MYGPSNSTRGEPELNSGLSVTSTTYIFVFQVLHDDEGLAFMLSDVVDDADIGMI